MSKVVVLFEVHPTPEGKEKYLELAASLRPLLENFPGFIRAERFLSLNEEGKLLSVNMWESEDAVTKWRNMMEHRLSQAKGKEALFSKYTITVAHVVREYSQNIRTLAPNDSNDFLLK